jgi:hypothetical protein
MVKDSRVGGAALILAEVHGARIYPPEKPTAEDVTPDVQNL